MTLESEFLHGRNRIPKDPCEACVMRARLAAEEHGGHWTDYYPTPGTHLRAPNDVIEADPTMFKRTVMIVVAAGVFLAGCGVAAWLLAKVVGA